MKKENKIISFNDYKKRKINQHMNICKYKQKYTITVSIKKHGENYKLDYIYPEELSEDDAYKILFNIYLKAARNSKKTEKPLKKILNNSFSLIYYENPENPKDFTFICTPKIDNELISALLWIMINNS